MRKIAILTNIIPTYRKGFYDLALSNPDYHIDIFCQSQSGKGQIKTVHHFYKGNLHEVPFIAIRGNALVWHRIPFRKILREYDIIVADGNPRHLSYVLLSSIAKLTGKKVVIWSTFHSRRNNGITIFLRRLWWRMFDYFLGYTEADAESLVQSGIDPAKVIGINNGLDQDQIDQEKKKWLDGKRLGNWTLANNLVGRTILISSGRVLTGRFDLILYALAELVKADSSILWVLIGDGEGLEELKVKASALKLTEHILFLGSVYKEEEIAPWFLSAKLFVYADAIGLSLMHAFGYSLPVITHDYLKIHGPEINIFQDGKTGFLFKYQSVSDLSQKIQTLLSNQQMLKTMGSNAIEIVQSKYNTKMMAFNFFNLMDRIC